MSNPQPGLTRLDLPAATLDAARPNLEDLRLLDPTGREVPYAIERPVAGTIVTHRPRQLITQLQNQQTRLHLTTGVTEPLDAITFETPAHQFIKPVTLEGSTGGDQWQTLVTGQPIFRQGGATQLTVRFPAGVWPFLRVTIADQRADAIGLTGVWLHAVAGKPAPTVAAPARIVEQTESEGATRLVLDLEAGHLTVASVRLAVADALFTRSVRLAVREMTGDAVTERTLGQGTIFRVDVPGQPPVAQLEIAGDFPVPGRELLVIVEQEDNPPLRITGVAVGRRPVGVTFLATTAEPYQLLTGNPRCAAPRYDVAALAPRLKDNSAPTPVGPLTLHPQYRPTEPLPEIENLGSPLDVRAWGYRKRVGLEAAGVQELELDLDVLARSAGHDLRLIRDGQQRPYVMDRGSRTRKLTPTVTVTGDPKRPSLSRWRLQLSHARLPVTRLSCTSPSPLFQRTMRLYEEPKDSRGETDRRELGSATWTRTGAARSALVIPLNNPPVTDTLVLETDNGDNPAITLENFTVSVPVPRLLFKAPVEPATFLYYGNPPAAAPRYDLALIAPRLLAAAKGQAHLAAEEALKSSPVGEFFGLAGPRRWIFWGALIVVVVVLLGVLTRLLPKA